MTMRTNRVNESHLSHLSRDGIAAARVRIVKYARSKRWYQRPHAHTEICQRVPCIMSPSGRHSVTVVLAKDGTMVSVTSSCDRYTPGAGLAAGRLSRDVCGYYQRLVRDYVLSRWGELDSNGAISHDDSRFYTELCLFDPVLSSIDKARSIATERKEANALYQTEPWTRGVQASEYWTDRVNCHLPVCANLVIGVRDNVPVEATALYQCTFPKGNNPSILAHRGRGTAWILSTAGLTSAAHYFGIDSSNVCHFCSTTVQHRGNAIVRPRRFATPGHLRKHIYSSKHRVRLEDMLIRALESLPGCGERL